MYAQETAVTKKTAVFAKPIDQEPGLQYDHCQSSVFVTHGTDDERSCFWNLSPASRQFPKEVKKMGKGQEKGKKGKDNKPKLSIKEKKKRKSKKEAA